MRKVHLALLAGATAIAVTGAAIATNRDDHVLKLAMPDGSVASIEYHGKIPPKVIVAPGHPAAMPLAFDGFDAFDPAPFGMFDRIAAQIDRQADAMLRQAAALQPLSAPVGGKLDLAAYGKLPAGTVSYSYVSTSSGRGVCSQSVRVTSLGPDRAPKVVSTRSGSCAASPQDTTLPEHRQPVATSGTTQVDLNTYSHDQKAATTKT